MPVSVVQDILFEQVWGAYRFDNYLLASEGLCRLQPVLLLGLLSELLIYSFVLSLRMDESIDRSLKQEKQQIQDIQHAKSSARAGISRNAQLYQL